MAIFLKGFESPPLLSLAEVLLRSVQSAANACLINVFTANDKLYYHPTAIHPSIYSSWSKGYEEIFTVDVVLCCNKDVMI